ncbi:MAG: alpha/beta hydrolase [Nitrososphaeraceae archaeon]|nr:alpha/beta hydrolase [Nitrososphaeraceae archaeon]MDW0228080.1 alpha/beta hydrolase [Nitrososphaeraceae archaeon]MDW0237237.1 alpha/beta hydrolase [Nitrososphaeraceae archaeon]MDW0252845.1 alpha/beta hydrolase [Nitrososphaeraceae archaeon]MDW0267621.1 alpha/beta hydrolase [Nitrososphaeraceae archaeon]
MNNDLDFVHRFNSDNSKAKKSSLTLLLLHGTGGTEDDLIPLGNELATDASILSVRGKVLENGMPRFFRRLEEGVFDLEDLKMRTDELADFILKSSSVYEFDLKRLVAVGYSNGANIGASLLLKRPEVLAGAILFRAMVPFVPDVLPDLSKKSVILLEGLRDPIVSKQEAESLLKIFNKARSNVTMKWQDSGHNLTQEDIESAKKWLEINF